MPRKKHNAEQIISILRQAEVEQSKGRPVEEVYRELQITPHTYYRWRKEYGDFKFDQAKRLKELENVKPIPFNPGGKGSPEVAKPGQPATGAK